MGLIVDIVTGLAWGDEGKGKIAAGLASTGDYDMVARWSGGSNAGHTIHVPGKDGEEKVYKTHIVPCGVLFGIKSVIGPGCVVNVEKLMREISLLEKAGHNGSLVKVSPRAHIVTNDHIREDSGEFKERLGTTGNGIAPAYRDKYGRTGKLAKDYLPAHMIWDEVLGKKVLCEGAQGCWLDVDYGNYPYVTSSNTTPAGALSLGFSHYSIRDVYGVAKMYDTRVGIDPSFDPEPENHARFKKDLAVAGKEIGVTTGRARDTNFLNVDKLIKAINITGSNKIYINKLDVFSTAVKLSYLNATMGHKEEWPFFYNGVLRRYDSEEAMLQSITSAIRKNAAFPIDHIEFLDSPSWTQRGTF